MRCVIFIFLSSPLVPLRGSGRSIAKSYTRGRVFLNLLSFMACSVLLHGYYFSTQSASLTDEPESSAIENPPSSDLASHRNNPGNQDHVGNFSTQFASAADESESSAKENPSKSKTVSVAVATERSIRM
jgi:hypothetical protein